MPHPAQEIRFCTSRDGTRIAYAICGTGPVLMWVQHWVHNLELDWDNLIWTPWLTWLTQRYTVVRYDWRGCGLSDRGKINSSLDDYVDDLEAVVQSARIDRFALFGMAGMGGAISTSYVVRQPQRVACLILQESHTKGRLAGNPTPQQVAEQQARLKVIELGWPDDTPAYSQFHATLHIPNASAAQMRAYNDLLRRSTTLEQAVGHLQAFWRVDIGGTIPQVRCPTLVFHARGDSVISFDEGRKLAALLPDAQFVPLESKNHLLLATETAWPSFIRAFKAFVAANLRSPNALSLGELTAREREILDALALGLDNRGIAAQLKISEKTVRNHVSSIFSKIGVTNRAQAVSLARDAGLGRRSFG
jgi:pimeloyl-ACP methyl ester carboxylesterase/DNA-binding CsgD family transcriptional regulator